MLAYTTFLEDLASHGYVVAGIEPPYNAPAMQFPNGRVIGRLTPVERGWEEPKTRDDQPRIYEQMVLHWARDMSFVLDAAAADAAVLERSATRAGGRPLVLFA